MTHNNALSKMRKDKDLKSSDIAKFVGVHIDTYHKWERGYIRPSLNHLKKLCEIFQATPEELGFGE